MTWTAGEVEIRRAHRAVTLVFLPDNAGRIMSLISGTALSVAARLERLVPCRVASDIAALAVAAAAVDAGRTQESNRPIFTRDNLRPPAGGRGKRWTEDGGMAHFGRPSVRRPSARPRPCCARQVCCAAAAATDGRWHKPQTASERRGSGWRGLRRPNR